jgi:AraC-like DNA-binding protein
MPQATRQHPNTKVWPAGASWREHVLMYVARDTRGDAVSETERINHFPPTPYCCITWMLGGELRLVQQGNHLRNQCLPSAFVVGCQSQHGATVNVGDRASFMAVFFADAFHALFKVDLSELQDRFVDARQVLNTDGISFIDAVDKADSHEQRIELIEGFLEKHAEAMSLSPWLRIRRLGNQLNLRLASTLLGVGERQAQRLARREAGLSLRGLSRLWRARRSHSEVKRQLRKGEPLNWGHHADAQGYADQSHMVKECKRLTGNSPQQLVELAKKNESHWMYRL